MPTRTLHLISSRTSPRQRAHFSIFVPSATNPDVGTKIHVVGAPMVGYALEFKRNFSPSTMETAPCEMFLIGEVDIKHIVDAVNKNNKPMDDLEREACMVSPPRMSKDFMADVDDTTNRRCQEWTMDYIRRLVDRQIIDGAALDIVNSKRDPPSHGIGLQGVGSK